MSLKYKTFNYLSDFSCLGSDCEDTCCKDWNIWFDKPHYELLKDTIAKKPAGLSEEFSKYIIVNDQESATDRNYAQLKLEDNGNCPFMAGGWCKIHKEYGEGPLSNVCAYYPRVLSRTGNDIELSGALSCPEMVRKCLFAKEDIEVVDFKPEILPRPNDYPLTRELNLPADHFYYDNFIVVRDTLIKLAGLEGFSLDSRLYFIASFANRLGVFYKLDADPADDLLVNELKQAISVSMLERMDDFVNKYVPAEPVAVIVAQAVLQLRVQQFPDDSYSQFIKQIFNDYESSLEQKLDDSGVLPPELLWQSFQAHRAEIDEFFQEELDRSFSRYLINCLFREWFITMPDLFTYVQMLLIRLAVLRFLVYSHPEIQKLTAELKRKGASATESDIQQLRNCLVEIMYRNARAIDHNSAFLQVIYDAIYEQQMMTYDFSLPFIKF